MAMTIPAGRPGWGGRGSGDLLECGEDGADEIFREFRRRLAAGRGAESLLAGK